MGTCLNNQIAKICNFQRIIFPVLLCWILLKKIKILFLSDVSWLLLYSDFTCVLVGERRKSMSCSAATHMRSTASDSPRSEEKDWNPADSETPMNMALRAISFPPIFSMSTLAQKTAERNEKQRGRWKNGKGEREGGIDVISVPHPRSDQSATTDQTRHFMRTVAIGCRRGERGTKSSLFLVRWTAFTQAGDHFS